MDNCYIYAMIKFFYLAHLIYYLLFITFAFAIELDESFINLSVLIHLVCLVTEPNGFISSDNLFYIVCSFTFGMFQSVLEIGMFHYMDTFYCDLCSDRQFR